MTKTSFTKVQTLRKDRNADVIRRMKGGDQLSSFNSYSSWFPPRPIIEKDEHAVKALYGTQPKAFKNVNPKPNAHRIDDVPARQVRKLRLA